MLKCLLYYAALLCLLFTFCKQTNAQTSIVKSKVTQIDTLISKGVKFENSNSDSLPKLSKQLYALSVSQSNKRGQIYAEDFEAYGYWMTANYSAAMQAALRALADAERWNVQERIPHIYGIIANLHKENTNYPMAFDTDAKGLEVARANKDTAAIISLLGLRAMFVHGYNFDKKNTKKDNSLELEFEALKMAESNPKYEQMRIRFYDNIAQTYKEREQYDQALIYGFKGVYLANKYNQPRSLTYAYDWIGQSYFYMGKQYEGINYLKNAIAISHRIKQPYREMELYGTLYNCYLSISNYKDAIAALKMQTNMRDSLQIAKNERQISEMQLKYEGKQKDKEIAGLGDMNRVKSRRINWIMVGLIAFFVLLIIILYQNVIIQKNNKIINVKNSMLQLALDKIAYVQSHQIRKPLASILGLMNVIKSENYHADKEVLLKMEQAAQELDQTIRDVIANTETE